MSMSHMHAVKMMKGGEDFCGLQMRTRSSWQNVMMQAPVWTKIVMSALTCMHP